MVSNITTYSVIKMGKINMCAKVDEESWYSFKNAVVQKHGKLRDKLGEEVGNALNLYLAYLNNDIDLQQHTRADKKQRLRNIMERMIVRKWTNEVDKRSMERFIREEGVRDRRTVQDYFKALVDYGFIRHNRFGIYKVHPSKIPEVKV
jgi:hypothetical protein